MQNELDNLIEKCPICSNILLFEQDPHHKSTIDGHPCGIAKCGQCNNIRFWILTFKKKYKIENSVLTASSKQKLTMLDCWDENITPWLYTKLEEYSLKSGRPIETYWTIKI